MTTLTSPALEPPSRSAPSHRTPPSSGFGHAVTAVVE